jgi:hypothetical protein
MQWYGSAYLLCEPSVCFDEDICIVLADVYRVGGMHYHSQMLFCKEVMYKKALLIKQATKSNVT